MAVFRIEKTRDYTVMANHHLRNTALSLKAKGLLSLMLSLPEDWDYTTKGLARICRDGVDSICATVRELEDAGYIIRERVRNANGRLGSIEYTILEQPRPPFDAWVGESDHFRIPALVTTESGRLIAAADARWDGTGDGYGLDTIVAYSTPTYISSQTSLLHLFLAPRLRLA